MMGWDVQGNVKIIEGFHGDAGKKGPEVGVSFDVAWTKGDKVQGRVPKGSKQVTLLPKTGVDVRHGQDMNVMPKRYTNATNEKTTFKIDFDCSSIACEFMEFPVK